MTRNVTCLFLISREINLFPLVIFFFSSVVSEGKKHDASMLTDSGLMRDLQQHAFSHGGQPMCLYGDAAYPLRVHLQGPFRFGVLTDEMKAYNTVMSTVRSSVEWLFGDIVNYFKFLDFKKNLKLGLGSIGKMYIVSALLFSPKCPNLSLWQQHIYLFRS